MSSASPVSVADRAPIAILGVPLDNVSTAETLEVIDGMIASRRPHYAAIVNVDFLMQATEDIELRRILFDANLVLAGEKAVAWAAGFLGRRLPEFFTAPQLVPHLLARAERKKWRVFLLGHAKSSLAAALGKIQTSYPTLAVTGTHALPKQSLLEMDHAEILRQVNHAKPEVLLVAFGCPQEEKWISMNFRAAGVPFTLGIGDNLDFLIEPTAKSLPRESAGKARWLFTRKIIQQRWELRQRKARAAAVSATVIPDPFGNFIIQAPARLDAAEAQTHGTEWLRAAENGRIMFDLTNTVFADSTGIGALVRLRRRAQEAGHQLFLIAPPPPIVTALHLMKLDEFFTIKASVAEVRSLMESLAGAAPVTSGVQATELQIRWTGEVTAANAVELGMFTESELSQISPDMTVVIDLARVTFVDSTGIGLMLRFKKNLKRRGLSLKFTHPAAAVRSVIRHTRLEEYLLGNGPE
jgi:exopolysaccharide biosynthesis WecB/TagA/CpsF family protein/anti-anti-sigma factor